MLSSRVPPCFRTAFPEERCAEAMWRSFKPRTACIPVKNVGQTVLLLRMGRSRKLGSFFLFAFLRRKGSVCYVTVFNSSATQAATFCLRAVRVGSQV